mmetsp:Transcript_170/g.634  ORF Transcript_170/g.634 Transcript_170/m.634 type:complete len:206 (+) Transcript_170:1409-2026(+)
MRTRDEHILGLQIRVDDAADTVEVVQADERVCSHLAHRVKRHALEVPLLDERQEIRTHGLEDHAHMFPMRSRVFEVVHKLHHARERYVGEDVLQRTTMCVHPVTQTTTLRSLGKQFNLIVRRLGVVRCALLHLHRDKPTLMLAVLAQPNSGEVTPPELRNDPISTVVHLSHSHHVVTAFPVPISALVVALRVVLCFRLVDRHSLV